jgi:hypothetical protein
MRAAAAVRASRARAAAARPRGASKSARLRTPLLLLLLWQAPPAQRAVHERDAAVLIALRDANPASELADVWKGAPSGAWPGVKLDPATGEVEEM